MVLPDYYQYCCPLSLLRVVTLVGFYAQCAYYIQCLCPLPTTLSILIIIILLHASVLNRVELAIVTVFTFAVCDLIGCKARR